MSTQLSQLSSTQAPSTTPIASVYTSLLYTLNNLSYRLQKFSFAGLIEHLTIKDHQDSERQDYFLLGKKIGSFRELLQAQKELIFFSYRKNFKLTATISSDFGWGCLLRVGQMVLAQAIRLHFTRKNSEVPSRLIIEPFLQGIDNHSSYSIQKLTNQAKLLWNKNIGQWYSMIQMLSVIQETHRKQAMKGTQELIIKIYSETIEISELQNIFQKPNQRLRAQSSEMKCLQQDKYHKELTDEEEIDLTKAICKLPKSNSQEISILLVLNTKFGNDQVNQLEFDKLLALMELPIFMGCIAGVQGKAKFITGKHGQNLSFLDPHLVQQAEYSQLKKEQLQTFVCKEYFLMAKDKLNPQISVCFFIKSSQDIKLLMKGIDSINQLNEFEQLPKFISYNCLNGCQDFEKNSQFSTKFSLTHSEDIEILEQIEENCPDHSSFTLIE